MGGERLCCDCEKHPAHLNWPRCWNCTQAKKAPQRIMSRVRSGGDKDHLDPDVLDARFSDTPQPPISVKDHRYDEGLCDICREPLDDGEHGVGVCGLPYEDDEDE